MKPRTVIPLVIGLGVGFFAIKMGVDMVQRAKGAQGSESQVVFAARQIEVATKITESMLRTKPVPAAIRPSDCFPDAKSLVGRVTRLTVPAGITITAAMLAPPGTEEGLRARIPAGFRAASVKVTEASAVAGFLVPGCTVDVFAGEPAAGGRPSKSNLILSNVGVAAVGQSLSETSSDGKTTRTIKTVTLLLRPEEVPILHAASAKSQIHLALRGDQEPADQGPGLLSNVLDQWRKWREAQPTIEPEQVSADPAQRRHVMRLLHGAQLEHVLFDETGQRLDGGSASPPGHSREADGSASAFPHEPDDPSPAREVLE